MTKSAHGTRFVEHKTDGPWFVAALRFSAVLHRQTKETKIKSFTGIII